MTNNRNRKDIQKSYEELTLKEMNAIQGTGGISPRAICNTCAFNSCRHNCNGNGNKNWWF